MAFKNQKLMHCTGNVPVSLPTYESVDSSDGSEIRVVYSDDCNLNIPSPCDYNLEELLRAGVPLETVNSSVIETPPSDVEGIIKNIISSDSSFDSNVSND